MLGKRSFLSTQEENASSLINLNSNYNSPQKFKKTQQPNDIIIYDSRKRHIHFCDENNREKICPPPENTNTSLIQPAITYYMDQDAPKTIQISPIVNTNQNFFCKMFNEIDILRPYCMSIVPYNPQRYHDSNIPSSSRNNENLDKLEYI
ncbi:hypothetical protein HZS_5173 [Henneguya salminicola]|nr:hypothetical protein HZS_5173 [Henneguya salminicola]